MLWVLAARSKVDRCRLQLVLPALTRLLAVPFAWLAVLAPKVAVLPAAAYA